MRGKDLRRGSVSSGKVRDFSLLARDFKPGQLPANGDGAPGPSGPAGQDEKIGGHVLPGREVLWGGYELPGTTDANTGSLVYQVKSSGPADASGEPIGDAGTAPRGWAVEVHRGSQTGGLVRVHVMCADIG